MCGGVLGGVRNRLAVVVAVVGTVAVVVLPAETPAELARPVGMVEPVAVVGTVAGLVAFVALDFVRVVAIDLQLSYAFDRTAMVVGADSLPSLHNP